MDEPADVRKVTLLHEEVRIEGRPLAHPFRHAVAAVVLRNPWRGLGGGSDLQPVVADLAPRLGRHLAALAVDALGGAGSVAAFGKMAAVGLGGEYEHATALIHTTLFGDEVRSLVDGTAWMVGNQRICAPGTPLDVPMAHKTDAKSQAHYHTATVCIADAPRPDELVVAVGVASGQRPGADR